MEVVYFTVVAVLLYFAADWGLNRIEERRGARFQNRSIIFFAILAVSAVLLFNLIRLLTGSI
jgi:hypothetical protein